MYRIYSNIDRNLDLNYAFIFENQELCLEYRIFFPFRKETVLHSNNVCMFVCPSQSDFNTTFLRYYKDATYCCSGQLWNSRVFFNMPEPTLCSS